MTKYMEWISLDGDIATVVISDYAREQVGDVGCVEVPEAGRQVSEGDGGGVVESGKAASEVYGHLSVEVDEGNGDLEANPELVNQSPDEDGRFFKMTLSDAGQLDELLVEAAYQAFVQELG